MKKIQKKFTVIFLRFISPLVNPGGATPIRLIANHALNKILGELAPLHGAISIDINILEQLNKPIDQVNPLLLRMLDRVDDKSNELVNHKPIGVGQKGLFQERELIIIKQHHESKDG